VMLILFSGVLTAMLPAQFIGLAYSMMVIGGAAAAFSALYAVHVGRRVLSHVNRNTTRDRNRRRTEPE